MRELPNLFCKGSLVPPEQEQYNANGLQASEPRSSSVTVSSLFRYVQGVYCVCDSLYSLHYRYNECMLVAVWFDVAMPLCCLDRPRDANGDAVFGSTDSAGLTYYLTTRSGGLSPRTVKMCVRGVCVCGQVYV